DMRTMTVVLAAVFTFALSLAVSAQYAGWTVPAGGKDEKSPIKSTPAVVAKGKTVFAANCVRCHGVLGNGDGKDSPKDEPAADLTDEFRFDMNPEGVVFYKITGGHPPEMPAFGEKLSATDRWTIVQYVLSLRKPS